VSTPRNEHLGELATAYALDAVDPPDRAHVRLHLEVCENCRAEVDALVQTVAGLAYAAPPVEPSPELRERVLAGLPRTAEQGAAEPGRPGLRARVALLIRSLRRPRRVAAIGVALAILLAAGVLLLRGGAATPTQTLALGKFGTAVVASNGQLVLNTNALQPPTGRVYEAWLISDGNAQPAGLLTPGQAKQIDTDLTARTGDVIAVTSEPASGNHQKPTTSPIESATV